ncbi:hypothetical protein KW795_02605, partial [Candidatus Microgenomates bacterium]|nr:hypothetical protein [Candidatus Microgenomates bacterium]
MNIENADWREFAMRNDEGSTIGGFCEFVGSLLLEDNSDIALPSYRYRDMYPFIFPFPVDSENPKDPKPS